MTTVSYGIDVGEDMFDIIITCAYRSSCRVRAPYQPTVPSRDIGQSQRWRASVDPQTASQTPCLRRAQTHRASTARCRPAVARSPANNTDVYNGWIGTVKL